MHYPYSEQYSPAYSASQNEGNVGKTADGWGGNGDRIEYSRINTPDSPIPDDPTLEQAQ